MQNLKINKSEITWERTKSKNGSSITYKNQILKHSDHISISKTMYVNGECKLLDLTHIPIELLDKIKDWFPYSSSSEDRKQTTKDIFTPNCKEVEDLAVELDQFIDRHKFGFKAGTYSLKLRQFLANKLNTYINKPTKK